MSLNKPTLSNLSPLEQGYVLGLFIGDGYAFYSENDRHYQVEFYLNSEKDFDIQDELTSLLEKIGLKPYIRKDSRFDANKIKVCSKRLFVYVHKLMQKFYETPYVFDKQFLLGVLSGFIDAEGHVPKKKGMINISQKDGKTMNLMKIISELFGVKCRTRNCPNGPNLRIWRGYIATSFKYLPHCSQKVRREYGCLSQRA